VWPGRSSCRSFNDTLLIALVARKLPYKFGIVGVVGRVDCCPNALNSKPRRKNAARFRHVGQCKLSIDLPHLASGNIGGWLLPRVGVAIGGGVIGAIINAFIGSVILLVILRLIKL
jgi:Transglycosylase associated protein